MNRIVWLGPVVAAHVRAAQMAGINKTMGDCITTSKGLVHVKSSDLQGSIRLWPAAPDGNGVKGTWGSADINYAIFQELLPGESAGGVHRTRKGGKPFLRPSADTNYPKLRRYIKESMR